MGRREVEVKGGIKGVKRKEWEGKIRRREKGRDE